jgi:hypothetical protein
MTTAVGDHSGEGGIHTDLAETPVEDVKFDEPDEPYQQPREEDRTFSRKCILVVSGLALGLIVIVTSLILLVNQKDNSTESKSEPSPPGNATSAPFDIEQFAKAHIPRYSWEVALRNRTSPQARALEFINSTATPTDPIYRLKQRYALSVLYFSTSLSIDNGTALQNTIDECDWFRFPGIDDVFQIPRCTNDSRYVDLRLENIALHGTIPSELGMLTDLKNLSLSGNYFHGTVPSEL